MLVDVFEGEEANTPIFVGEFASVPRAGEHVSFEAGGYFRYYNVLEVWHRQDGVGGKFRPCLRVSLND